MSVDFSCDGSDVRMRACEDAARRHAEATVRTCEGCYTVPCPEIGYVPGTMMCEFKTLRPGEYKHSGYYRRAERMCLGMANKYESAGCLQSAEEYRKRVSSGELARVCWYEV